MLKTVNDKIFRLKPYQSEFYISEARFPAMVSAWGTGKSLCMILKAVKHSETYPHNLGVIFRKEYTDLRDSTIKDFERYTGLTVDSGRDVKFPNGSVIMFRHLEEMNNIQNINLGWFGIEQGDELDSDEQFFLLHGRLRREGVPHFGMVIANTKGHNWIYKLWKSRTLKNGELYEATTFDNADNLPGDFVRSMEDLKVTKPKIFNRFVMNSWEDEDTVDIIIRPEWVRAAADRIASHEEPIRRVVSVDVARFGDDKTVFYALENGRSLGKEVHEKRDTMETVGLAQIFAQRHKGIKWYAVDEIGVGGGVVDRLRELGLNVIAVNSSKKSNEPEKYYNLRTEIYAKGAERFELGRVKVDEKDVDLIEQLSWAKYKAVKSNGLLQVEAKEDIKERFGRSPDDCDAFLNGLWSLGKVDVVRTKNRGIEGEGWQGGAWVPIPPWAREGNKEVYA